MPPLGVLHCPLFHMEPAVVWCQCGVDLCSPGTREPPLGFPAISGLLEQSLPIFKHRLLHSFDLPSGSKALREGHISKHLLLPGARNVHSSFEQFQFLFWLCTSSCGSKKMSL